MKNEKSLRTQPDQNRIGNANRLSARPTEKSGTNRLQRRAAKTKNKRVSGSSSELADTAQNRAILASRLKNLKSDYTFDITKALCAAQFLSSIPELEDEIVVEITKHCVHIKFGTSENSFGNVFFDYNKVASIEQLEILSDELKAAHKDLIELNTAMKMAYKELPEETTEGLPDILF